MIIFSQNEKLIQDCIMPHDIRC